MVLADHGAASIAGAPGGGKARPGRSREVSDGEAPGSRDRPGEARVPFATTAWRTLSVAPVADDVPRGVDQM